MRGYLSAEADSEQIKFESRTVVYRDPGDTEEVLVEKSDGTTISLGVADVTVSRKKDGQAPVMFVPRSESIEIHNNGNSNGVTVIKQGAKHEISEGCLKTVRHDADISIGFNTQLHLTVEREAKKYINSGEGDIVLGDKQKIDRSTSVGDDNIINRSDIGGEGAADLGDDNVINQSSVGTTGNGSKNDSRQSETPSSAETKYCIKCGAEVLVTTVRCPACDKSLKDVAQHDTDSKSDTQNFCEKHQRTYAADTCPLCTDD